MTRELELINAVVQNKDVGVLYDSTAEHFLFAYADVWKSLKDYYNRYHAIPDISIVKDRHPDFDEVVTRGHADYYLNRLREEHIGNRIDEILSKAQKFRGELAPQETLEKMQNALSKLNRLSSSMQDVNVMDFDMAESHFEQVRERARAMGGTPGIPTGFPAIDSAYPTGMAAGDLIVVFGWTAKRKSFFTTLVACNAFAKGFKPMIVSLEMTPEKVRNRVYTILGKGVFSNSELELGEVKIEDFRQFAGDNSGRDFIIVGQTGDGEPPTPDYVRAKIDQHKPDLVIYDYAQIGADNSRTEDMVRKMKNMSDQFKGLAMSAQIPLLLISSATPDSSTAADEAPRLEQVAYSKQLAYNADLAYAVHARDNSDLVEIVGRKNRNGPLFAFTLDWNADSGVWEEVFE